MALGAATHLLQPAPLCNCRGAHGPAGPVLSRRAACWCPKGGREGALTPARGCAARRRPLVCAPMAAKGGGGQPQPQRGADGEKDWYAATRERPFKTVKEEIEWRRAANREANNGRDRKDLYTDNWDGDVYKGSKVNVLTVVAAVSILTPLAGLVFAWWSYGRLWG